MHFRYVIVICVALWIAYECTKSYWAETLPSLWAVYKTPIKVASGVLAILVVLMLPSIETLAATGKDGRMYATLRQLLVNDRHHYHFEHPETMNSTYNMTHVPTYTNHTHHKLFSEDQHARAQFRDGVKLARGDANVPDYEH
jgi:hypothetical protein